LYVNIPDFPDFSQWERERGSCQTCRISPDKSGIAAELAMLKRLIIN
jgi:hypothetical protein